MNTSSIKKRPGAMKGAITIAYRAACAGLLLVSVSACASPDDPADSNSPDAPSPGGQPADNPATGIGGQAGFGTTSGTGGVMEPPTSLGGSAASDMGLAGMPGDTPIPDPNPPPNSDPPDAVDEPISVAPEDGCHVYAASGGSGAACSADAACSLEGARDKARTLNANMNEDLVVCLGGGRYELSQTFTLTGMDSGSNGFKVIYRPLTGATPVLSGGQRITNFEVADAARGIYRASVPSGIRSRQLWVNGQRAQRARSADNMGLYFSSDAATVRGFTDDNSRMVGFANQNRIELVGTLDWRAYRCPVESITGTAVRLQDPCWQLSQDIGDRGWWNFKEVIWVENAYELLDEPGEFYLDETALLLYYKPRAGEDLTTAEVIVPVLERLMHGQGSAASKLRDVEIRGLTFAHGTWYDASSARGYTSWQAGFLHRNLNEYYDTNFFPVPSNIEFENIENVRFERNHFLHLGAGAVHIHSNSQNIEFIGNRIEDVSGRGLTIGDIDDVHLPEEQWLKQYSINNNYIARIGVEYHDSVAIFLGYTQDAVVEHNWVRYTPYTGISLGWGWTVRQDQSIARDNIIRYNRVEDFMSMTFDGSGVYALGIQPGSSVDHNYIVRGLPRGEGIFPDQGAAYMDWVWNVIDDVGYEWLHDWSDDAHHNNISNNFTNQPNLTYNGGKAFDTFENNLVIEGNDWPDAARQIMAEAGLEPAYADLATAD
jgi:hypothetical protein